MECLTFLANGDTVAKDKKQEIAELDKSSQDIKVYKDDEVEVIGEHKTGKASKTQTTSESGDKVSIQKVTEAVQEELDGKGYKPPKGGISVGSRKASTQDHTPDLTSVGDEPATKKQRLF